MHKLVVEGGRPLVGTVAAAGAKNAALPLLFATLLAPGEHRLHHVPDLADTSTALSLLGRIGCPSLCAGNDVRLDTTRVAWCDAPKRVTGKMRASVLLLGPLLARCGEARVPRPGGCAIGARPIDEHLSGLEQLGCRFTLEGDEVHGVVSRLRGADIHLSVPTVTGTENLVMAAVLAEGTTRIHNAAREPEVTELCHFLNALGARISGLGSATLHIEGVSALRPMRQPWRVLPDRIETGTWLCAAALTGGDVTVAETDPRLLGATLDALRAAGCTIEIHGDRVRCFRDGPLQAFRLSTGPYPDLATDMQPLLSAVATLAPGLSVVHETLFESRFRHADELAKLGARIDHDDHTLRIYGVDRLEGAPLVASDLRAGAALLIAGLAARGTSEIVEVHHIDRGYERLVEKVSALGGSIRRVDVAQERQDPEEEPPMPVAAV